MCQTSDPVRPSADPPQNLVEAYDEDPETQNTSPSLGEETDESGAKAA